MTSGQLQKPFDLTEHVNNLELIVTLSCLFGALFIFMLFSITSKADRNRRIEVAKLNEQVAALKKSIATLEARLKSFEALERLGIASQLGEETIARTDELVTTLEHEMQKKIDQLRATQRRALEEMRVEMDEYRANMARLAK